MKNANDDFQEKRRNLQRLDSDELNRLRDQVCSSIPELTWFNYMYEAAIFVERRRRWAGFDHSLFSRVFLATEDPSIFNELKPLVNYQGQRLGDIKKRKNTKVLFLSSKFGNFVSSQEYNGGILRALGDSLEVILASRRPIDASYSSAFKSYNFEYAGDVRNLCASIKPDKVVDLSCDHHDVLQMLAPDVHIADPMGFWTCGGIEHTALYWQDAITYRDFLSRPIVAPDVCRMYLPPKGPLRQYPKIDTSERINSSEVVLGAFCRTSKLSLKVIELWAEILVSNPQCRLIFAFIQSNPNSEKFVKKVFKQFGVAEDRVSFLPRTDTSAYLYKLNHVDINLCAMPEQGGISCMDSLIMGCPYPVCDELSSLRVSSSALRTLGLSKWVATTVSEYRLLVEDLIKNVDICRNQKSREEIRNRLLDSPLANCQTVATVYRDFLESDIDSMSWIS